MIDPVSKFEYPEQWISLCKERDDLSFVESGLAVLTSDGKVLRRGYTTGTTAAAACQAAIESLGVKELREVNVTIACGIIVPVEVLAGHGSAACYKYPGDYPDDATAGTEFRAMFIRYQDETSLDVGPGIGRWDHDTPRYGKGDAAISHTAMACILSSVTAACRARGQKGALIYLEAVDGDRIALRTLNHRVGVLGGISVLGSTGLVEPWDDHLGQDSIERAKRAEKAVITTGRVGLKYARLRYPDQEVVLVGANIREALDSRKQGLTLFGLPALIIKFIDPSVLEGRKERTIEEVVHSRDGPNLLHTSVQRFKSLYPGHGIVIIDRAGRVMEAVP
ncbi:MAG: cobalt-precorrin-5B (C(1))-methyltransferase [Methanomassiliicoccus sp.]|nr:cobalt-precorrin-5B (C(1))-methyltransferase [Methanomassiliicoccus sp.]